MKGMRGKEETGEDMPEKQSRRDKLEEILDSLNSERSRKRLAAILDRLMERVEELEARHREEEE